MYEKVCAGCAAAGRIGTGWGTGLTGTGLSAAPATHTDVWNTVQHSGRI
ncbi:MAG: hypothetical protein FWF49_00215 [Oscillospiraceae bacterium]|nr:hypothetical protein [Oscillospiraceae bacterium]